MVSQLPPEHHADCVRAEAPLPQKSFTFPLPSPLIVHLVEKKSHLIASDLKIDNAAANRAIDKVFNYDAQ